MSTRFTVRTLLLTMAVTCILAPSRRVDAQPLDSLSTGARVRLDLSRSPADVGKEAPTMLVGSLLRMSADSVVIDLGAGHATAHVPRSAVRAVWMSQGPSSRGRAAVRGAAIPALGGAAFGAMFASINRRDGDPSIVSAAMLNGAFSAAIAGARAAWMRSDRWHKVSASALSCQDREVACAR